MDKHKKTYTCTYIYTFATHSCHTMSASRQLAYAHAGIFLFTYFMNTYVCLPSTKCLHTFTHTHIYIHTCICMYVCILASTVLLNFRLVRLRSLVFQLRSLLAHLFYRRFLSLLQLNTFLCMYVYMYVCVNLTSSSICTALQLQ